MCAFILNGFRLLSFIQIDYLKPFSYILTMLLRGNMCGFNCLSLFKCMLL